MKTYDIPFDFIMPNCKEYDDNGLHMRLIAKVDLSDEEVTRVRALADKADLEKALPDIYGKLEGAVKDRCRKASYGYALMDTFEGGSFYVSKEKMELFESEGMYEYEPFNPEESDLHFTVVEYNPQPRDKKLDDFGVWLEEYYFDLEEDQRVEFLEKYFKEIIPEITEAKLSYRYSFTVPEL